MRIVVVADVHANLAAFEAVLADALADGPIDGVWSMGDIVGYGPQPGACIALLRSFPYRAVAGNHDLAAVGLVSTEQFNPSARIAALWTADQLTYDERNFLAGLPLTDTEGDFTLVHGSLADPVWEYLVWPDAARVHFRIQSTPFCLVGHSHIPLVYYEEAPEKGGSVNPGMQVELGGRRFIANPGGLGQPRDGDPRSAYALVDTQANVLSFRRVEYDIRRTQARMRVEGLPESLIERLARGR